MDAIRNQLAADHRVLDDLFCRLLHDVQVLSHHDLQLVWCELEHRLLSHMDVEEQLLFPLAPANHHVAVARARTDHVRIRGLVCALGLAIEAGTAREPAVRDLISTLHVHAEREDRTLYRFACERASSAAQYRMAATLRTAARSAHETAVKTLANRTGCHDAPVLTPKEGRKLA
jgi:hypothetical protein